MRKAKKLLALLLSLVMVLSMISAVAFAEGDPDAYSAALTIKDSAGNETTIQGTDITAADSMEATAENPWTHKNSNGEDVEVVGTFYSLKSILQTVNVSLDDLHGFVGVASDGFRNGFLPEDIDDVYIYDQSTVTENGTAVGAAGTYGTAVNGSAGNKWAKGVVSIELAKSHVMFFKKGKCRHYCAICGEDEPGITVNPETEDEKKIYDCEIKAAASVTTTAEDAWSNSKKPDEKYIGTFYNLKSVLENANVDISDCHGLVTRASDGFTNGFSDDELDSVYIYDMGTVMAGDKTAGKAGTYGTALNGGAGNKWARDFVSVEVAKDHVMFFKGGECKHYCAVCGADEEVIIDPAIAPAIGKAGKTAGSHYLCGAVIKAQETVPALAKKAQPMTVKAKSIKALKSKTLKKKAQTLKLSKTMTIKNAQGTKSYKITKVNKKKFKKYFKINAKTGKITIKKKLKKGTYKVTVQVTAAGNNTYNAGSKKVTLKIKVK